MFLREASTRVSFRLNPWQGLPGVACSKHARPWWLVEVVRSPTCASFVKRFLMRLSGTDVELVVRNTNFKRNTVRHERDGGDEAHPRPLSN
jgi:hypothetical protein